MKKASNFASSSRCANRCRCSEVEIGVGNGAGIAPGAGVDRRRPHEGAELHLTGLRHVQLLIDLAERSAARC